MINKKHIFFTRFNYHLTIDNRNHVINMKLKTSEWMWFKCDVKSVTLSECATERAGEREKIPGEAFWQRSIRNCCLWRTPWSMSVNAWLNISLLLSPFLLYIAFCYLSFFFILQRRAHSFVTTTHQAICSHTAFCQPLHVITHRRSNLLCCIGPINMQGYRW